MQHKYFGDGSRGLDFSGTYRGRVVNRADPLMEGRVGVFLPNLITDPPADTSAPAPQTSQLQPSRVFSNAGDLRVSGQVRTDVFFWARPAAFPVENGAGSSNASGAFFVPKLGTIVEVYFEGRDPNKPYWRQATPTVAGDVTAGKNIGQGTWVSASAANWKSASSRPDVHVITETDEGHVIYLDRNPSSNAFSIRWANGHTVTVCHNERSGIVLETELGQTVRLDDVANQVVLSAGGGAATLVLDGNTGVISVNSAGGFAFKSDSDISFSTGKGFALQAASLNATVSGTTVVRSAAGASVLTLAKNGNTMVPWFSNDPHNF